MLVVCLSASSSKVGRTHKMERRVLYGSRNKMVTRADAEPQGLHNIVDLQPIVAHPAGPLFRLLIRRGDVSTQDDAWMLYTPLQLLGFGPPRGEAHLPHT